MRFIDIAKRLNRSTKSVALKSWKIGLRKRLTVNSTSSKRLFEIVWSERNKRVLRQTYLEYEAKAIGERLNRSAKAVYTMAKKLGLRKRRPIHVWKPSEYAFLAELSTLEAALKIRCSRQAVANKRREMRGLKRATKSYREYLLQTKKNGASERRCNG
ncbi:hypothetical protein DLM45_10765 [Hyphomicrobium methylovorum]|nr:hypothetical protein [Hyphomicrobium methylovorum]